MAISVHGAGGAGAAAAEAAPSTPFVPGRRTVFLLEAASAIELRLLEEWIARNRPADVPADAYETVRLPASRRERTSRDADARLESALVAGDDPLLAPLRVAWLPAERDGVREARFSDLLTLGDPRDPGLLRQAWVARRHPDRVQVVAGEPAAASELRRRWKQAGVETTVGFAAFVILQAALALERAERRLRGARYKVPRFVRQAILARPSFRGGLGRVAHAVGRPLSEVSAEAERDLAEIAATHSPYVIDLVANLIRVLYRRGYGEALHYDRARLCEIQRLGERHPLVFLPTHKSNLDHLVLQYALHENGHPPNHTAGGINMNFFPVGPLIRRSGLFFIRRTFKDDEVYKFVLRQYVDYLIEKRFPLEWYIEGGRSRSGKLLPPRYGLLAYVIDAWRRGKSDDVVLIPVSIAYDQIQDVGDYVAEQRGGAKAAESFGWMLSVVRGIRNRLGDIHIRFGEPLSLVQALGDAPAGAAASDPDEASLTVAKIAFEVAVRMNRATPITPTSLVTLALLGPDERALAVGETVVVLRNWVDYVRRRELPTTEPLELDTPAGAKKALDALVASGVVSCFAGGVEPVYAIGPDQHLAAAYYRNTILHFFQTGAIAELALVRAAEDGVADRVAELWEEVFRLRDLLKFELFFAEKEAFRAEVREEMRLHDERWEEAVAAGPESIQALLRRVRPFRAHRVIRPFVEAYRVVADALAARDPAIPVDESALVTQCLALGRQYALQRRIRSPESISKVLFATALRLAANRGLLAPGGEEMLERRRAFAAELREVVRRTEAVAALAASRRSGLVD